MQMRPDLHARATQHIKDLMDAVWGAVDTAPSQRFSCGGRSLHLRCADVRLQDRLMSALHLGSSHDPADFEIRALSGRNCKLPPWTLPYTDGRHLERMHIAHDGSFAAKYDEERKVWLMWDRDSARGLYWIDDPDDTLVWEAAAPLRTIFAWSFAHTESVMLHGGAVGEGRAALLVGHSGSGKSTTVAASAMRGMPVYGDDLIVAERREDGYRVHALYDAVKLNPDGPLKERLDFDALQGSHFSGKIHIRLSQIAPGSMARSAPVVAVIRPVVAGRRVCTIVPEAKSAMQNAIAPPTVFGLRGLEQPAIHKIAQIVRSLPCYRLELCDDPFEAADFLRSWLDAA